MKKSLLMIVLLLISITISAQKNIKVAAAANLRGVFEEIKENYEKENPGIKIDVTFGSSGNFVQQILNGASFDLFMAADRGFPLKLQKEGATYGKVSTYIYGRLAMWSNTEEVSKGLSILKNNSIKRIAIAKPETAPYGECAIELLKRKGLFNDIQSKIIYADNISAAAQYAFTGNAEVGFIALSLALSPEMKGKGKCYIIPQELYPPIEQACVLIKKNSRNIAAERFMKALLENKYNAIWKKYGYFK